MKNKLKLMVMILISMVVLAGCGSKSPSEVVDIYFKEVKKGENSDLEKYVFENMDKNKKSEENKNPKMEEALNEYMSKIDVKVIKEEIKDDKASVDVELTGPNFANITMELLQESLANAFNGVEVKSDDMSNTILEKVKSGKIETRKGKINLTKVDKEWKIKNDEDSMSLILGKSDTLKNTSN